MENEQFKEVFETVVPQWLQVAYDYARADERLTHLWISMVDEDNVSVTSMAFGFGEVRKSAEDIVGFVPEVDLADLRTAVRELSDLSWAFAEIDAEQIPNRTVVRYDVAAESMDAEFSWEPVSTPDTEIPMGHVQKLWVERLVQTGNDSADFVLTPEQKKL